MTNLECNRLDDYLDGLLIPSAEQSFQSHLDSCDACRQAVLFERALVTAAQESHAEDVVPAFVTAGVKQSIRRSQLKKRLVWASGLAALLVGCLVSFAVRDPVVVPSDHGIAIADRQGVEDRGVHPMSTPTRRDAQVLRPTVVRMRRDDVSQKIAVKLPTQSEGVTLVMLYPTIHPRSSQSGNSIPHDDTEN